MAFALVFLFPFEFEFEFALTSNSSDGEGDGDAVVALLFAFELNVPPSGIPCSVCPVAGAAGCTAWLLGSALSPGVCG